LRAPEDAVDASERRRALRLLDEAERFFGRSAVIDLERRQPDAAPPAFAPPTPPRTAWEHTAIGRALLRRNLLPAAAAELRAALALDPAGRWCNFYYGVCAYRMAHFDDAVTAFSTAIGAAPEPAFFRNRAQAYRALGRNDEADRDEQRATAATQPR
jgi:tetratricopeptide (TPR) repeat protein